MRIAPLQGVVDSSQLAVYRPNTVAIAGDSITAQNTDASPISYYGAKGYFTWANFFLGHRLNLVKNAGIAGNTSAQLLARLDTDVIAYKPGYCIVLIGINDVTTGVAKATTIANIKAIYDKLLANNIVVIACAILPASDVAGNATMIDALCSINNWIRDYTWSKPNMIFCGWHYVYCNQSTGSPIANATADGKHPTLYGAALLGKYMSDLLSPIIPKRDVLFGNNFDSTNILANGMTLGNNSGLATSFSANNVGSPTLTKTKVARVDGLPGEWQQINNTGAAGTGVYFRQTVAIAGKLNIGDIVYAQCEVQADNDLANVSNLSCVLTAVNGSFAFIASAADLNRLSGDVNYLYSPFSGVLRTPNFVIPVNAVSLIFDLQFVGQGTVRVTRCEIKKVSSL